MLKRLSLAAVWPAAGLRHQLIGICLHPRAGVAGRRSERRLSFFAASLQQEVERRVLSPSRQDLVIAPASLGNGAGRLGAARLAWSVCQAAGDDAWQSPARR